MTKLSILAAGAALVPTQVLAETILGVTVFSRHGDRTSKYYDGAQLTDLGKQQNFQVGAAYRDLYLSSQSSKQILGISEDKYDPNQVYASAPDSIVLLNTATAFLQGLYPPLEPLDQDLATSDLVNGSTISAPLNGYQYVELHGEDENSPDYIWIKGEEGCDPQAAASATYNQSSQYNDLYSTTQDFYAQFWPSLQTVAGLDQSDLNFANAYEIFDLLNTAQIHNTSSPPDVTDDQLFQLRTLADASELGAVYNASQPMRSFGARTLSGAILAQLNETVASKGVSQKFSLLAGSYDTFQAFFGIAGLLPVNEPNFYGLPDYASTMAFELLTEGELQEGATWPASDDDLKVRFLFKNGSAADSALEAFPLFGKGQKTMGYAEFRDGMLAGDGGVDAITELSEWCDVCGVTDGFCAAEMASDDDATTAKATDDSGDGISKAVAGVIGAMVTLGVVGLAGLAFFLIRRKKSASAATGSTGSSAAVAESGMGERKAGSLSS